MSNPGYPILACMKEGGDLPGLPVETRQSGKGVKDPNRTRQGDRPVAANELLHPMKPFGPSHQDILELSVWVVSRWEMLDVAKSPADSI